MFDMYEEEGDEKKIAANKAKIWWNQESVMMSRYDIFFFVTMSDFVKVFLKGGGMEGKCNINVHSVFGFCVYRYFVFFYVL